MKRFFPIRTFHQTENLIEIDEMQEFLEISNQQSLKREADSIQADHFPFFFAEHKKIQEPKWFRLQASDSKKVFEHSHHWTEASRQLAPSDDVKLVWELSRFHWCTVLARATCSFKDKKYLETMNQWLNSWRQANPLNQGINWSCGQEASYRLIHILMAHFLMKSRNNLALKEFVAAHLSRIYKTLGYAVAQKSNHGFTESVALFVGGAWLAQSPDRSRQQEALGRRCKKKGRRTVEKLITSLIQNDGSFAMYSTNYQRVVMQLLSFALFSIDHLKLEPFGPASRKKIVSLVTFHESLVCRDSGGIVNLGANDGAYPLKLNSAPFSDHRPACITLRALLDLPSPFVGACEDLIWLRLESTTQGDKQKSKPQFCNFPDAGLVLIELEKNSRAVLRYPAFRFRPSQSDIGHLDLWVNGINVLCDRGTYRYTSTGSLDFSGQESHNTLWVPGVPAMRRKGRFLYRDWPEEGGGLEQGSALSTLNIPYIHRRRVTPDLQSLNIEDIFQCPTPPVINWNLGQGTWDFVDKNTISDGGIQIKISGDIDFELKLQAEQRADFYNGLTDLQCLKVYPSSTAGRIVTDVCWTP